MVMFESEGRCPVCDTAMDKGVRGFSVGGKSYWMPYRIYCCWHHGYFMWRRSKHEIITLKMLESEATKIEELPPDVPYIDLSEIIPVKMKCKYCGHEWKVHSGFLREKTTWCPSGHELNTESAVVGEMPIVKLWMPPTSTIAIVQWFASHLFPSAKAIAEDLTKKGYKVDEDTVIRVLRSEWEKGNIKVTVTAKTLEHLANALKVPLERLKEL